MAINFIGLDTAVSGMYSNQKALEVTGHNISNISTPGHARQQAVLSTANTQYVANNWVEMGANIQEIRQIRNIFLITYIAMKQMRLGIGRLAITA